MSKKKFDFGGYATKVDLKCSDGRVIKKDAFKHNDGTTVPLVWQHLHKEPNNVLGHAILENRADGVYAYCTFNDTDSGKNSKILVEHGDITALSIHANELKQKGDNVLHGSIREVSLVLSGANPGALIDNLSIQHGDDYETDDTEAIIYTDEALSLSNIEHADAKVDKTVEEVFNTFTDEQKNVVYSMIAHAMEVDPKDLEDLEGEKQDSKNKKIEHSTKGGKIMKKNVFDTTGETKQESKHTTLTHDQFQAVMVEAQKCGSLKTALQHVAPDYGIENIDILFPDARVVGDLNWQKREDDWVQGILSGISKSPFSRIKSLIADMDIATARAKGYIKTTEKKEVYFSMSKRETLPCTVYVKQKLDRDDIIDVVDFDVVALVRMQLRTLLDEELAMAALIGDGREIEDQYKINESCIRPIYKDVDLYAIKEELSTNTEYDVMVKEIALSGKNYKGSGNTTLYTTNAVHMNMLWITDSIGRRLYESDATLCSALGVARIVEIPQLEGLSREVDGDTMELTAIKVNLKDYTFGADKGGQIASFDDFDIDFNQHKYLMETRCSGCLTKPKSAQIFEFNVDK